VAPGNETLIWKQVLLPTGISLWGTNIKATGEDNLKPSYSVGRSSQPRKGMWKESKGAGAVSRERECGKKARGKEWSGKKKFDVG